MLPHKYTNTNTRTQYNTNTQIQEYKYTNAHFQCTKDMALRLSYSVLTIEEKKALSLSHKKPLTVILVVLVLAPVTIGLEREGLEEERLIVI